MVKQRDGAVPRPFFLKKWIIWKSSILKRFIFVVPEYGNLTSVKTHRDRFGNSKEGILEQKVQIFGFGKGRRPHRGFGCCPVVALSFFCLLCPRVFENFLIFALDCPFRVFTLESFFSFSFFWLSYYALDNSKFIPNKWRIDQDFFVSWGKKRQQPHWLQKIFSRKKLFSPSIHVQSKWTF